MQLGAERVKGVHRSGSVLWNRNGTRKVGEKLTRRHAPSNLNQRAPQSMSHMIRCGVVLFNEISDDVIPRRYSAGGADLDNVTELGVAVFVAAPPGVISTPLKRDGLGVVDLRDVKGSHYHARRVCKLSGGDMLKEVYGSEKPLVGGVAEYLVGFVHGRCVGIHFGSQARREEGEPGGRN